jgi:Tfp pilus assembly protein PilF
MSRIPQLLKMLESQPQDSFLKHALALEYLKEGSADKARELFTALLAADPGYVGSYYHLGKIYEAEGNLQKASETYEAGMKAAKAAGDRHAYNELQSVYEELNY